MRRKMRIGKQAIWLSLLLVMAGAFSLLATGADAQSAPPATRLAQAIGVDESSPVRPPRRLRIYPRYNPGPNAVRVCNATYVPEYRPGGTVIVPRMSCVWRRG